MTTKLIPYLLPVTQANKNLHTPIMIQILQQFRYSLKFNVIISETNSKACYQSLRIVGV